MINLRKHYEDTTHKLNSFFVKSNQYPIELYIKKIIETTCPDCDYDPVRKESTNIACPTCNGKGKLVTVKKAQIPAWLNIDSEVGALDTGGVVDTNTTQVSLANNTYNNYRKFLLNRHRVFLNDVDYEIVKIDKLGVSPFMFISLTLNKIIEPQDITR